MTFPNASSNDAPSVNELIQAVVVDDLDLVQRLISQGVSVDSTDENGCTALLFACAHGHVRIVEYLMAHAKATIRARDENGWTALHYATRHGHTNVVTYLVGTSVMIDMDVRDNDGLTPLHYACGNGYLELVQCLVCRGATVNAADHSGLTALHYASIENELSIVEYLVVCGGTVDAPDHDGWTPWQWARYHGHTRIGQCLMEHGARVLSEHAPLPGTAQSESGQRPASRMSTAPPTIDPIPAAMERGADPSDTLDATNVSDKRQLEVEVSSGKRRLEGDDTSETNKRVCIEEPDKMDDTETEHTVETSQVQDLTLDTTLQCSDVTVGHVAELATEAPDAVRVIKPGPGAKLPEAEDAPVQARVAMVSPRVSFPTAVGPTCVVPPIAQPTLETVPKSLPHSTPSIETAPAVLSVSPSAPAIAPAPVSPMAQSTRTGKESIALDADPLKPRLFEASDSLPTALDTIPVPGVFETADSLPATLDVNPVATTTAKMGVALAGLVAFGAAYVELFSLLATLWMHQVYFGFGVALGVFVGLVVICATVTTALVHFRLCAKSHYWWWLALLLSVSTLVYTESILLLLVSPTEASTPSMAFQGDEVEQAMIDCCVHPISCDMHTVE